MHEAGSHRPDLKKAVWLLHQMVGRHPITEDQVDRFAKHPAGPILPDLCVESRRLPTKLANTPKGWREDPLGFHFKIIDLSVTPDGRPCIIIKIRYQDKIKNVLLCGQDQYDLCDDFEGFISVVQLLGFANSGKPVTYISYLKDKGDYKDMPDDKIFYGDEKRLEASAYLGVTLLSDGSIMHISAGKIFRNNGELVAQYPYSLRGIFETNDKSVICVMQDHNLPIMYMSYINNPENLVNLGMFQGRLRMFMSSKGLVVLNQGTYYLFSEEHQTMRIERSPLSANNSYRAHYTELPGMVCYVGKTSRHNQICWVVNEVEMPGFEYVSPVFYLDEKLLYYGIIGRHLYTMEISN